MAPAETAVLAPIPAHAREAAVDNERKYDEEVAKYGRVLPPAAVSAAASIRSSGPQGQVLPHTIVNDPADWQSKTHSLEDFTYRLSESDVSEIIAATDAILAQGVKEEESIRKLTAADYHLPTLGPKLKQLILSEVTSGKGLLIVKGFPVQQYEQNRAGLIVAYWGLAVTLGKVQVSQTDLASDGTVFGSVLNHITPGRWANVYPKPHAHDNERANLSRLDFHSDQGCTDVVALLCIKQAREGGDSKVASAIAVHNELIKRGRKDLVEVLSEPGIWYTPIKSDQSTHITDGNGEYEAFEENRVFEYHDGYLSTHYSSSKFAYTTKDLSDLQKEAIWAVAAIAEDPSVHLSFKLEPGDIEFLHNPSVLHARTDTVDAENRHLLRWWVHTNLNPRPIAPHYAPRSNVAAAGGFNVPHHDNPAQQRLPLYPYARHDGLGQSHVA